MVISHCDQSTEDLKAGGTLANGCCPNSLSKTTLASERQMSEREREKEREKERSENQIRIIEVLSSPCSPWIF